MELGLIIIAILFVVSYQMATSIGSKRVIGVVWIFLLSFFLTPIIGWIISFTSPFKGKEQKITNNYTTLRVVAILFAMFFCVWFITSSFRLWDLIQENISYLSETELYKSNFINMSILAYFGIGFGVLTLYLLGTLVNKQTNTKKKV